VWGGRYTPLKKVWGYEEGVRVPPKITLT